MSPKKKEWTPWYPALRAGDHYRAVIGGIKIEECLPEKRDPNCTICNPGTGQKLKEAEA